jgi:hypothetical protein
MGSPESLFELMSFDMISFLLWPVLAVCATCSIYWQDAPAAVLTRRHESVVQSVVVGKIAPTQNTAGIQLDPRGALFLVGRRRSNGCVRRYALAGTETVGI